MSKYTTEVRFICETYAGLKESGNYPVTQVVEAAAPLIFENFPIFDEAYRLPLEVKILRHFYTREICAETVGLWKLWLNNKMWEIMPYFNKLYKSELLDFNPLFDTDYNRTYNRKEDGDRNQNVTSETTRQDTGKSTSVTDGHTTDDTETQTRDTSSSDTTNTERTTRTNDHVDKYAITPQGSISNEPIFTNYLTDARDITDDEDIRRDNETTNNTTATGNSGSTSTADSHVNVNGNTQTDIKSNDTENLSAKVTTLEDYIEHLSGKRGTQSYSTMLQEYRDILLNIDIQIIESLNDLFMNIY